MEHKLLNGILTSAQTLLCDIFESGLSAIGRHEASLLEQSAIFRKYALSYGEELLSALAGFATACRQDPYYDPKASLATFAQATAYINNCISRANYLAALSIADVSE
ncbi:MAG: hypothetical protein FWG30_11030 [Eubacteriaceae bacterium]|nr:hypothetical protein [Eubacteriaceae bacterium]